MTFAHLLFFNLGPSGKNINTDVKLYNTLPSITREKSSEIPFFVFRFPIEFIQQPIVYMIYRISWLLLSDYPEKNLDELPGNML
jgi:hypothetical protein